MKVVPKNNKNCYEEYKREAMILKELKYPGIPTIYDMEEVNEYLYLIEEYINGETLYERVHSTGILSREEIINLGINLCNPIIYLCKTGFSFYEWYFLGYCYCLCNDRACFS